MIWVALVLAGGTAPVAEAGLGVLAYAGDTVVLNGTGSSDAEGEPLSFAWTQEAGALVQMQDGPTAEPSFVIPEPGYYRFGLVVNDGSLDSEPDAVGFLVPDREATPSGSAGCAGVPAGMSAVLAGAGLVAVLRRRVRRS